MSVFKPFRAVRPVPAHAAEVAALPYDVMTSEEARERAKDNPLSFLHVDKAEIDLPVGTDLYSDPVYETAAKNLRALSESGVCRQDETPMFYVYRQTWRGRSQTGVVGCAGVDDYLNGVIRRHELTRAEKEADRIRHVDTCGANTGPIFLAYRPSGAVKAVLDRVTAGEPVYDFVSEGEVRNEVWLIPGPADISALETAFAAIPALYIADGHHRCASAVRVAEKRRAENPGYTGKEEFNFFLAVCFSADELRILDYNRVLADMNGLTEEALLEKLGECFAVTPSSVAVAPAKRHEFGFLLRDRWYRLALKEGLSDESDPVGSLDVSLLQRLAIGPVFGVADPRTDPRIDFVGGIRGLGELEKRCRTDMTAAFSLYPTSLDELMRIADAGEIMPPKSTWFEPKLLSGLFIHKLV